MMRILKSSEGWMQELPEDRLETSCHQPIKVDIRVILVL